MTPRQPRRHGQLASCITGSVSEVNGYRRRCGEAFTTRFVPRRAGQAGSGVGRHAEGSWAANTEVGPRACLLRTPSLRASVVTVRLRSLPDGERPVPKRSGFPLYPRQAGFAKLPVNAGAGGGRRPASWRIPLPDPPSRRFPDRVARRAEVRRRRTHHAVYTQSSVLRP